MLGEFEMSLPSEGVPALALGYTLQVNATPSAPGTPSFRGQAWESALLQVRGFQITLPYGAWPASNAQKPTVYVLDAAAEAAERRTLAFSEASAIMRGALIVVAPGNLTLGEAALISLPVSRVLSRVTGGDRLSQSAVSTLEARQFRQGKWRRVVGALKMGLQLRSPGVEGSGVVARREGAPGSGNISANVTGAAPAPAHDLFVVGSKHLGPIIVVQVLCQCLDDGGAGR